MKDSALAAQFGSKLKWPVPPARQMEALAHGLRVLKTQKVQPKSSRLSLAEQPMDTWLLSLSRLYRRSRELYLREGGRFRSTLVTSPRTLSSPILVEPWIEYSPIERELYWSATDPHARKDSEALLRLRTYASSVFHEQNHRILWRHLPPPPPPSARGGLKRYQNFAESLVIATDMALGDELGPKLAPVFYLSGVVYDPGTSIRSEGLSRRQYRNYLQALVLGTYLTLELYSDETIARILRSQFPMLGQLAERAAARSLRLDPQFISITNPSWQRKFSAHLSRTLSREGIAPLTLSDNPMRNPIQYVIAETWFKKMGL